MVRWEVSCRVRISVPVRVIAGDKDLATRRNGFALRGATVPGREGSATVAPWHSMRSGARADGFALPERPHALQLTRHLESCAAITTLTDYLSASSAASVFLPLSPVPGHTILSQVPWLPAVLRVR